MHTPAPTTAQSAYAALARYYDCFTRLYDHSEWLSRLEALARKHGLPNDSVLDVACGTGKSLGPLVRLGYKAVGCDISEPMLDLARAALPEVRMWQADMRALAPLCQVGWVTCLDDAVNYLLDDGDLPQALASMGAQLVAGGLLCFDINTLSAHRDGFNSTWAVEEPGLYLCWQGRGCAAGPGEPGLADIDIFVEHDGSWRRSVSSHRQRWWSEQDVVEATQAAGLELVARYGQHPGARLERHVDEMVHTKSVFFLRRPLGAPIAERG
jgi:dTDP-3-amino-3,6-dideoxy-alpha-D-glucopyranose N,N-dimethyltransferase/dTDP-3-amino-3,4,6-trideoxy-alpha-D-glucopyranose N,N-dimethyltransferase